MSNVMSQNTYNVCLMLFYSTGLCKRQFYTIILYFDSDTILKFFMDFLVLQPFLEWWGSV